MLFCFPRMCCTMGMCFGSTPLTSAFTTVAPAGGFGHSGAGPTHAPPLQYLSRPRKLIGAAIGWIGVVPLGIPLGTPVGIPVGRPAPLPVTPLGTPKLLGVIAAGVIMDGVEIPGLAVAAGTKSVGVCCW